MAAALSLGERFGRIYDNPYNAPAVNGVKLDFDLVRERRWARLESARTDVSEARPGEEIMRRNCACSLSRRAHRAADSGKDSDLGQQRNAAHFGKRRRDSRPRRPRQRQPSAASWTSLPRLRCSIKSTRNNRLYVSLLEADPEARVADKVMPTLPISVMNIMDGMRGNQEMIVSGESSVDETATPPLDYVVSGAQLLTVTVK